MNSENEAGFSAGVLYKPLVQALFSDNLTLLLGCFAAVAGIFLTAFHTGSAGLHVIGLATLTVSIGRGMVNYFYHKADNHSVLDGVAMRSWEMRYTIGAVASTTCLGVWCFYSMAIVDDRFAAFASCAVTFGNLVGVSGRNYTIPRLINFQSATAGAGIFFGLVSQGGYYIPLAMLIVVFVFSVRKFSGMQRETLFTAISERGNAEKIASQFNTALDNVPEAICMFSAARKLEVANTLAVQAFQKDPEELRNMPLDSVLDTIVRQGTIVEKDSETISKILHGSQPNHGFTFKLGKEAERTIKLRANPMSNGGMVATFEDITKEVQAATTIDHMSRFDRLTGLINRDQLRQVLGNELNQRAEDQQCSAMLINLDQFKQHNETLGHSVGDFLLCEATRRIKEVVGESGYCARYGGDEFVVVLRNVNCLGFAKAIADQLLLALSRPLIVGQNTVQLTCSIGISVGGRASDTAEQLLKQADMALFCTKKEARGQWRVFDQKMSQELEERRTLEKDLSEALQNGEFETYYQPLVSVEEQQVTTCEALLRWKHPKNGFVSPAVFIPLAEETGAIEDIGAWVLQDACRQCATWPDQTRVAVNLSAVQFRQGDIVQTVKRALADARLHPSRLELEITESLMLSDMEETVARLNEFIAMGVRISLDDFGTGYSSLSYMNDLPLNKVKIDRSFVQDLAEGSKSLTLVQAICALAQELGLSVVVEGVETAEQLETLLGHAKVTEIQGYYFSKPVDRHQLSEILDRSAVANGAMLQKMRRIYRDAA